MRKSLSLAIIILGVSLCVSNLIGGILGLAGMHVYTGVGYGKINFFISKAKDFDVLVFGSSRANHHVDIQRISERAFNVGMDGRDIYFNSALFQMLDDSATVLFHVDVKDAYSDGASLRKLVPFYNKSEVVDSVLLSHGQIGFFEKFFSSSRYTGAFLRLAKECFFPDSTILAKRGYEPLNQPPPSESKLVKGKSHFSFIPLQRDMLRPAFLREITRIQEHAERHGIRCVFFTSPLYHGVHKTNSAFLDSTMRLVGAEYLDFSDAMVRSEKKYWKDASHLSREGAELFTDTYLREILSKRDD